jgi:hypothetical protein
MIPRDGAAFGTGASQGKVLEMKLGKVFFDLSGTGRFVGEMLLGAAL